MNSNHLPCPLCKEELKSLTMSEQIHFQCNSCGLDKKGPNGYNLDQAYEYILKPFSNKKRKTVGGFATKGRKKHIEKVIILEDDKKIMENVEQLRELIAENAVPTNLLGILNHKDLLPVHYEHLKQVIPTQGTTIAESGYLKALQKKLEKKGIEYFYGFQDDVHKEIIDGNNVIITAPTGMGKTEAFLLPLIQVIVSQQPNPTKRNGPNIILIYPTKALAADQKTKVEYYCSDIGLRVGIYDGDTSKLDRKKIYSLPPDILITNPDMIHYHLMGNLSFQSLISRVKFLVVDEIHLCIGSFGSNVLWIIRRLRRFSPHIQCIGASATISNAKQFGETLFDAPVTLVSTGTARKSDMHLSILYPTKRSNLSIMADVSEYFVRQNNKTLCFGNGHRSAETINIILKRRGLKSGVHRAGLPHHIRKNIENSFKSNQLEVLVSTPTLELGIDIGNLDSVVSSLTNLTSFVQRIGRAGRQGQSSYATLVLRGDDPISAYYARNPSEYLSDIEPAFLEPDNPFIAIKQMLAMILDKPLTYHEGSRFMEYVDELQANNLVYLKDSKIRIKDMTKARSELNAYSIRGIGKSVSIYFRDKIIGERSLPIALTELHPGAIYLHSGSSYEVDVFSNRTKAAKLSRYPNRNERTQALRTIWPEIRSLSQETDIDGFGAAYGKLELTETVYGYLKKNIYTNETISTHNLEKPINYSYETAGFILALPKPEKTDKFLKFTDEEFLGGTFHAVEHIIIESGNSITGGGANQIGGISLGDTGLIFVYDGNEGGSGLSKLLFDSIKKSIHRSLKILEDCPCKRVDGCPRCTYSYQCGNNNQPLNRLGAIESLKQFGKTSTQLDLNYEGVETFVISPD